MDVALSDVNCPQAIPPVPKTNVGLVMSQGVSHQKVDNPADPHPLRRFQRSLGVLNREIEGIPPPPKSNPVSVVEDTRPLDRLVQAVWI